MGIIGYKKDTKKEIGKMKKENVKLSIYIAKDTDGKFRRLSEMLGLTKSAFGNICILMGVANITRILEPEKIMTESDWRALLMGSKGLNIDFEELIKGKGKENG